MAKRLILCDCSGTQQIDAKLIADQCDVSCSRVYSGLCGPQIDLAAKEIATGDDAGDCIIACAQERALFEELADEIDAQIPDFLDLRDRAGWSGDVAQTGPKMAALVAEALVPHAPIKVIDIQSAGRCLILGTQEVALEAAAQLAGLLSVTVLLPEPPEMFAARGFDVVVGQVRQISGSLGNFDIRIDALQQLNPAGRGPLTMGAPRDGAHSDCDIVLDLRGERSPFGDHPRDGYLRADPRDLPAISREILAASQLVGGFDKPHYVANAPQLCGHSRAGIVGCSLCIDNCGSSAILPDGDHVTIDPNICAGCGDCVALCPSGALTFQAPETSYIFAQIQTLARGFSSAGGVNPKLLIHDDEHGSEMISLGARFGRGLPADVIPLALESTALFGHAEMLAALACGFARVDVLLPPRSPATTQTAQATLADAIAGEPRVRLLRCDDPDQLGDALYGADEITSTGAPILPQGTRRQVTRLAAKALNPDAKAPILLPEGAPYGTLKIDTDACTLCLSCVSLCPSGALSDNPDSPQLRFVADACLQCGICVNICPESALGLVPQLDLSDGALNPVTLHEEEPFACISCGALFGVKSSVEKIISLLVGKHPMFASSDAGKLIQMCDKCRVEAHYHADDQPFQAAERPRVITTEDYFTKRKDH
ncbi:MAG: (4Fe-4S)-binding protein [Rhodobacteraceae bacterium]|nr:MAG: (4Fe-4S)-binding protein [Paracoccaceae bacterium]